MSSVEVRQALVGSSSACPPPSHIPVVPSIPPPAHNETQQHPLHQHKFPLSPQNKMLPNGAESPAGVPFPTPRCIWSQFAKCLLQKSPSPVMCDSSRPQSCARLQRKNVLICHKPIIASHLSRNYSSWLQYRTKGPSERRLDMDINKRKSVHCLTLLGTRLQQDRKRKPLLTDSWREGCHPAANPSLHAEE